MIKLIGQINPGVPFQPNIIITYNDILNKYSEGFLDQILRVSVAYLLFNLLMIWYFMDKKPENEKDRLIQAAAYFSLPISLFFPVLMIGYKTGWFI